MKNGLVLTSRAVFFLVKAFLFLFFFVFFFFFRVEEFFRGCVFFEMG